MWKRAGQITYPFKLQVTLRSIQALPSCRLLIQGLGEELALYFAAHGARLILSSRKEDQLQVNHKLLAIADTHSCVRAVRQCVILVHSSGC